MQGSLEGIIVALSTPITEKESLDKQALEKPVSMFFPEALMVSSSCQAPANLAHARQHMGREY